MATNGKDGMTPNMNFSGNSSDRKEEGVFGYLQNRGTKNTFSKDYWKENTGYLDSALKDLKEMQKLYNELEKSSGKMTSSQEKTFKTQKRALELQLATLNDIKDTQEVSDRDAIRSIQDSNKLRQKGLLEYQALLDSIAKRQERLKNGDKELAKQLKEDADYINDMYVSANKEIEQQNFNIEATGKILKNTQTSFAKAMSNTLGGFSKGLMDLSNMFNLEKLASLNNSGLNKFINDKISIQNDMMKQFGFETKAQYIDFKNGLDATLGTMGSLYNGADLKQYMSRMSSMGIADTKLAQEQMKASIMSTKYLGVSVETQTEMFKWMKRTNDYDMLDEHNKVITSLLKSQLGVSKEQLDALSQVAYGGMEDKAALGMSSEAIQAQAEASSAMGAVLTSMYDEATAKSIQNALNDFMLNPGDSKWMNAFGSQYHELYNALGTEQTREGQAAAINRWLSAGKNSGVLNLPNNSDFLFNSVGNKITNSLTGFDNNSINALQSLDMNKYSELMADALTNIDEANAEQFVQETTEITWLENIYNRLDKFFTSIDSAHLVSLANLAFTAMVGSKMFDIYSKMSDLGLVGKLFNSSEVMTKLGTAGSGLLATGGGVLLGVAATTAIMGAIAGASEKMAQSAATSGREQATAALKGTALEGNQALIGASGMANKSNTVSGFGNDLNSTGAALSYLGNIWGTKDRSTLNKKLTEWMYKSNVFNSTNKALVWAFMLDSLGDLSAFNNASGTSITQKDLRQILEQGVLTPEAINERAADFIAKGWYPYLDNNKSRMKNFTFDGSLYTDGYHKAGLSYVPKENYRAILHKGEMVLSADEANALRRGYGTGGYEAVPWPITSRYNTSSKIRSGYHTGTDFGAPLGTPVGAAIGGEIVQRSWGSAWGNHIIVRGDNGLYYLYAHLSKKAVEGGRVNTGQTIGYIGSTGNSTGPHLHFEVQKSSSWARGNELDPAPYVTAGLLGDSSAITPTVEEAYGSPSSITNADGSTSSMTVSSAVPIRTRRFMPSSMTTSNYGHGGADRIVGSINGGFGKLMNYLDDIRKEQDLQKEMINTFSRTNTEGVIG